MDYRKLWKQHFGDIPVDEHGISFEIHHINGDHNDNRIENLKCVSVSEHYDIHYSQNDIGACTIMRLRIGSILDGKPEPHLSGENHPMYGRHHTIESRKKISENHADVSGENNGMFGKTHTKKARKIFSEIAKKNFTGVPKSPEQRKKMSEAVKLYTCPHCGKSARGSSMFRWHFDNCKEKD